MIEYLFVLCQVIDMASLGILSALSVCIVPVARSNKHV